MSRIGKQPIIIPNNVKVSISKDTVLVEGPKGKLNMKYNPSIIIENKDNSIVLTRKDDLKQTKAFHGLYRVLINNMVNGVTKGYEKKLDINGTGYKASLAGNKLVLSVGFSHQVEYPIPEGIKISVEENVKITVSGIDKHLVGHVASEIRGIKPPEPYKAKGIKYVDEVVRRKAGKASKK